MTIQKESKKIVLGRSGGVNSFVSKKNKFIMNWLEKEYGSLFPTELPDMPEASIPGKIWVCWWQGVDKMPSVPRLCVESIKRHSGGRQVVLLDKYNIHEYIDIPEEILDKHKRGILCTAHLCDYIRFKLLCRYGGFWLDATILLTDTLNLSSPGNMFASVKIRPRPTVTISEFKWTTFCLASCRNSPVFKVFSDVLEYNFSKGRYRFIDYLFIDFIMQELYEKCQTFRNIVDKMPYSNERIHDLVEILNAPADNMNPSDYNDTFIYKLSWRINTDVQSCKETVFQRIKKQYDTRHR